MIASTFIYASFEKGLTNQLEFNNFLSKWSEDDLFQFWWKSDERSRRSSKRCFVFVFFPPNIKMAESKFGRLWPNCYHCSWGRAVSWQWAEVIKSNYHFLKLHYNFWQGDAVPKERRYFQVMMPMTATKFGLKMLMHYGDIASHPFSTQSQ